MDNTENSSCEDTYEHLFPCQDTYSQESTAEPSQPMIREIELFDTYVAGTGYLEDQSVLGVIRPGQKLTLLREAGNEHDRKAILVLTADGKKLGYVPRKDNTVFSRLMDAGKMLSARIMSITEKKNNMRIDIKIYLLDY